MFCFNVLLEVVDFENIIICDIILINLFNWICYIMYSQDVVVDGIWIINDFFVFNVDGIDIIGSQRVWVINCDIIICDDVIVLKIWKDGQFCEDVIVINCILEIFCVVLKFGIEFYVDYCWIIFSNCVVWIVF